MQRNNTKIYTNTIGLKIRLSYSNDISDINSQQIYYFKPAEDEDGNIEGYWDAILDKENNEIYYITQENDLDVAGDWRLMGVLDLPGWKGKTETVIMTVYNNFV